ncbi:hypothetical protein [Streptomyces lavendulae]|uniref:hypothetical protein n=1 Tax=Streptomyces lavendulae TaxID=1914 RepID=UPI0036EA20AE
MSYEAPPPEEPPEEAPPDAYDYGHSSSYGYDYEDEPPPDQSDLRAETLQVDNREEIGRLRIADDFLVRDGQWQAVANLIKKLNGDHG